MVRWLDCASPEDSATAAAAKKKKAAGAPPIINQKTTKKKNNKMSKDGGEDTTRSSPVESSAYLDLATKFTAEEKEWLEYQNAGKRKRIEMARELRKKSGTWP